MQCPKCSSENPVGSSVCQSCSTPLTASVVERPRMAQASKTSGRKSSIAAPVIILVVLAIIAAWWFLLANPSPARAEKVYINDRLKMWPPMVPTGPAKPEVGNVKDITVTGDRAIVSVDMKIPVMDTNTIVVQRFALVKEGSFFAKKWRVDEGATMQLQMEDAGKMMNQFLGMMKQGNSQGQMPGMSNEPQIPLFGKRP